MLGYSQLVHISQIRPLLVWLNNRVVNIKIPILLLGTPDHLDKILHGRIKLCIILLLEEIACPLNPFRNITIPEKVERYWPH